MKAPDLLYRLIPELHPEAEAPTSGTPRAELGIAGANRQHLTLADLRRSERGVVLGLSGGRSILQRLAALGFTPGADVEMAQNYGWGPLIVSTRGARVALGRGEAQRVTVEPRKL